MATCSAAGSWKFGDDINTDLVIPGFAVFMPREEQLGHVLLGQPAGVGGRGAAW